MGCTSRQVGDYGKSWIPSLGKSRQVWANLGKQATTGNPGFQVQASLGKSLNAGLQFPAHHAHTCIHMHAYIYLHTYTCIHIHACIDMHEHFVWGPRAGLIRLYAYTLIRAYLCKHVYVCKYMYASICMHAYVCMYMHDGLETTTLHLRTCLDLPRLGFQDFPSSPPSLGQYRLVQTSLDQPRLAYII